MFIEVPKREKEETGAKKKKFQKIRAENLLVFRKKNVRSQN